jgi:hypothetical protein
MDAVTVRDVRNYDGDVPTRGSLGKSLILAPDGAHVAGLRPLRCGAVFSAELPARRASPLPWMLNSSRPLLIQFLTPQSEPRLVARSRGYLGP